MDIVVALTPFLIQNCSFIIRATFIAHSTPYLIHYTVILLLTLSSGDLKEAWQFKECSNVYFVGTLEASRVNGLHQVLEYTPFVCLGVV
jgi:hypothetical protein